jgi:PAS domain S-box-containing protein
LAEVGVSTVQLTRAQNVVFSIRNVERRKNSAEELRKYRAALDVLPIPAFACDLHGAFEVLNPPVLKALGMVDEMEAQKKHFGEMLPDMIEQFQAAVKGSEVCETKELTRPDGSAYTIELRLKPMRKGEEITGVAGTMTIT